MTLAFDPANGNLTVKFVKSEPLLKYETAVSISEATYLEHDEDYYIHVTSVPQRGQILQISFPPEFVFNNVRFAQQELWRSNGDLVFGVGSNFIGAATEAWLLPGLTFICQWKRK